MRVAILIGCLLLSGCDGVARFFGVRGEVTIDQLRQDVDAGRCRDVENINPADVVLAGAPEGLPYYLIAFCKTVTRDDLETALQYYQQALAGGADPFWVYYNRGQLYLTRGNLPLARSDIERAYALNPDHPDIGGLLTQVGSEAGGAPAPPVPRSDAP